MKTLNQATLTALIALTAFQIERSFGSGLLVTVMKEDADSLVFMRGVAKTILDRLAKDKVIP